MAKRPTPKKRRSKSQTRTQHSAFMQRERRRLANLRNSPYAVFASKKDEGEKAIEKVTRIKA